MAELQELLTDHLRDLYDAEKQLTRALPKLAKAASNEELKRAFTEHLEITRTQLTRLEQAFEHLGEKAKGKPCKGIKGLIDEGAEHLQEHEKGPLRDLTLAAGSVKVEHYEIAAYTSAKSLAAASGQRDVASLMQQTLREEEQTGKLLMQIAERLQKEMRQGGGSQLRGSPSRKADTSSSKSSAIITDHEEIRRWAEERNAKPACVRGTGNRGDTGMLRLDFPGYSGGDSLQEISWEEWFRKFDEEGLALLHQQKTAAGKASNFNKLIARQPGKKKR